MAEEHTLHAHCNECRRTTTQRILKSTTDSGSDEEQGFYWKTQYDMLQCCGCEEVSLKRTHWFSEEPEPSVLFYPARVSRWLPEWHIYVPSNLRQLLPEVYAALQADSGLLAMMGARTMIESPMIAKVGDHGTFSKNLQALEEEGYLSKVNRQYLEAALEAGHAATHRAHRATAEQLNTGHRHCREPPAVALRSHEAQYLSEGRNSSAPTPKRQEDFGVLRNAALLRRTTSTRLACVLT